VKDGKKGVIAEMSAVVDVRDANRYLNSENGSFGKLELDAWHAFVSLCEITPVALLNSMEKTGYGQ
jgi:hypothetical protein